MKSSFYAVFLACFAFVAACGGGDADRTVYSPPAPAPARGYPVVASGSVAPLVRDEAPVPQTTAFAKPVVTELMLPNKVRLLLVERHAMPFVSLFIKVGGAGEDDGIPGAALVASQAIFWGTKTREPEVVWQGFDGRATTYHSEVGPNAMVFKLRTPSPNLDGVLERIADVLQNPIFDDDAHVKRLAKLRNAFAANLSEHSSTNGYHAARALDSLLDPKCETDADVRLGIQRRTLEEIQRFHATHFAPDRTTIILSGDFKTADATAMVQKYFAGWQTSAGAIAASHEVAANTASHIVVVDHEGDSQAAIIVAMHAPSDPVSADRDAARAIRYWLGAAEGRLQRAVREKTGASYGLGAAIVDHRAFADLRFGGMVQTDRVAESLADMLDELAKFRTEPPSEQELREAAARTSIIDFATNDGAAEELLSITRKEPLDHFLDRTLTFKVPPPDEIMRVAKIYLAPERIQIAIAGDAKRIVPELEKRKLGPVAVVPW